MADMNLFQKLVEIRKEVKSFNKDTKGFGYTYVSGSQAISKIREKMDELNVLLVPFKYITCYFSTLFLLSSFFFLLRDSHVMSRDNFLQLIIFPFLSAFAFLICFALESCPFPPNSDILPNY